MGPTSYPIPLKDMPTIYKYQRSLTGFSYRSMDGGSFTKLNILILDYFQVWPRAITCITSKRNPMCVPHLSFTRHCFTASEPVQYPGEVALVPCKHSCTASRPVQYPGAVTHTSLIASIYPSSIYPYRYLYLCVKIACATFGYFDWSGVVLREFLCFAKKTTFAL